MKTLEQWFRSELEAFLERTGMGLATLGRKALGDPNLMREIARGRSPTLRTVDRIREFMATYERERHCARDPPRPRRKRRPRTRRTRRRTTMTEKLKEPGKTGRIRLLRRWEVEARTGLACSTIYLWMAEGRFPRPIPLGDHTVGWVESEIEEWLDGRVTTGRAAERPSSANHHGKDGQR